MKRDTYHTHYFKIAGLGDDLGGEIPTDTLLYSS